MNDEKAKKKPTSLVLLAQGIHDDEDLAAVVAATMQDIAAERLNTRTGFAILAGARVLLGLSEARHRRGGPVVLNPRAASKQIEAPKEAQGEPVEESGAEVKAEVEEGFCRVCGKACLEHKTGACRTCRKGKPDDWVAP